MAAAASPMVGALATTAFANQQDPVEDTSDDASEPDVKLTSPSDSGLNPSDPQSVQEFTKKINDLMGRLNDSPEKTEKSRFLAWAGGLNDPSGNGSLASGVVNAAKSESEFDLKDKALRAQYTPMIVGALTQQQQFAAQQKILANGLPNLVGMPINVAQNLNVALPNFKIMENWKLANPSRVVKGSSWNLSPAPNGGMISQFYPSPKDGVTMQGDPNSPATVIPNAPQIDAGVKGANAFATSRGNLLGGSQEGMTEAGTGYKLPGTSAFPGAANTPNPFMAGLEKYSGQNTPAAATSGPLAHPEQQPPAQTPPQPGAPGQGQPPPGAPPMAPNTPVPGGLHPSVTPQLMDSLRNTESGGKPFAVNPKSGAMGPYQFMPQTVADLHKQGVTFNPFVESEARPVAAKLLSNFIAQNGGDTQKGLAGYGGFVTKDPTAYTGKILAGAGQAQQSANQPGSPPSASSGVPPGALQTSQSSATQISNAATEDYNKEFFAKKLPSIMEAGTNLADANLQALNTAQVALKNIGKTGWGTEAKMAAAKVGAAIGIPGATEYASDGEKFVKAVYQNNLNVLQAQKGNQSDNDAANVAKTYAQLGSQEKTNQYILDTSRAIEERKKMQASYYSSGVPIAKADHGGDMSEIDRQWLNNVPPISAMPSMKKYAAEFKKAGIDPNTGRPMK